MSSTDPLETFQWINISLLTLALVYFNYYIYRLSNQLKGNKPDLLSIGCFIFVELTALFKIFLRSISMLCINADYPNKTLDEVINKGNGRDPLVCTYNLAYYFGVTFFTIALFFNSARWLYLILFVQKGLVFTNTQSVLMKGGLVSLIVGLGIASIIRMAEECTDHLQNAAGINKANIAFALIVQIINCIALGTYIYANKVNKQYTQIEVDRNKHYMEQAEIN